MSNFNMRPNFRPRGHSSIGFRPMRGSRPSFQDANSPIRPFRPRGRPGASYINNKSTYSNRFQYNGTSTSNRKHKKQKIDLSRPWVHDSLRAEFANQEMLFKKAKSSNHEEDWAFFKEQKDKCMHIYSTLKNEYKSQHPYEVLSSNEDSEEFVCEPCDRAFDDEDSYRAHLQEHQTCGIDGCKFNAHQLLVLAHIKLQHSTGLYDKIRNISTPEDIEKWRAERKRNYPSKSNIEIRYKQQAEMLKRGERIGPNKDRFGRNKDKQKKKENEIKKKKKRRRVLNNKKENKDNEQKSLIDEKADWNGTMFPFQGTSCLDDSEDDGESDQFSDDEWEQKEEGNETTCTEVKLNNALGALMGAYNSDCTDSETEEQSTKESHCNKPSNSQTKDSQKILEVSEIIKNENDDEDNIVEEKILKAPVSLPDKATEDKLTDNRKRPIAISDLTLDDVLIPPKKVKQKEKQKIPPKVKNFTRHPTLLEKLLENDIRHERNVILQCVRYIVNNNFFDEIKPSSAPGPSSS